MRDLILREDLRRIGCDISLPGSRGLAEAHLNVAVVERLRRCLSGLPPATLLDVGAAYGQFSLAATLAFPGLQVHAFEPLPEEFEVLERTLRRLPGAVAHPVALGDGEATLALHRSRNKGSSSLLRMLPAHTDAFPGTECDGTVLAKVHTLDDVVATTPIALRHPVLLKIDVQGFEDRVLRGARRTLQLVNALIVEMSLVHLYEGQILFAPLKDLIEASGLIYAGEFDRVVSPVTGEVLQIDGLFRRASAPGSAVTSTR